MKISTENLAMEFNDAGRKIALFHNLNLSVESGSSLAIVGASGVGKTTLLYLLGGLERPKSAKVHLGDTCITHLQAAGDDLSKFRGRHIGFIFQFHYLFPEFDARENVAMPLIIQGVTPQDAFLKSEEILCRVGLADRLTHRPGMLSGGEQQRVQVARSLIANPGIILADEPTGSLDQATGDEIIELILEMKAIRNITLVVVTHSKELSRRMGRIVELRAGGIYEGA